MKIILSMKINFKILRFKYISLGIVKFICFRLKLFRYKSNIQIFLENMLYENCRICFKCVIKLYLSLFDSIRVLILFYKFQ